ncbi:unnamed protein product [Durusdinium trenchii]
MAIDCANSDETQGSDTGANIFCRSLTKVLLSQRDELEGGDRLLLPMHTLLQRADGEGAHSMKTMVHQVLRRITMRHFRGLAWRLDWSTLELQVHVANLQEFQESCAPYLNKEAVSTFKGF